MCILTIDGGSIVNLVASSAMQSLGLTITPHWTSYTLEWVDGTVKRMTHPMHGSLLHCTDTIQCDIVNMIVAHILLGCPWQYGRQIIHDGFHNAYPFKIGSW